MSRYVSVPAEVLMSHLRGIGDKVAAAGGKFTEDTRGGEIIIDLTPPKSKVLVRVYTSLATDADTVRECGADAVRMVLLTDVDGRERPLSTSRRLYRTAPQGEDADRQRAFLTRLTDALREEYSTAGAVPSCPACSAPMVYRDGKFGPFYGCSRYPTCARTVRVSTGEDNA